MSSVNVLGNSIRVKQAQELIKILQANDKLTTQRGFSGDETELDLSNKNLSAGCAVLVTNEIGNMGALSKLIFGGGKYRGHKDGKLQDIYPEPVMLKMDMTEADFSNKNLGAGGAIIISVWITHRDKGAISSVNLLMDNIVVDQLTRPRPLLASSRSTPPSSPSAVTRATRLSST
jgi:hypothetical protein